MIRNFLLITLRSMLKNKMFIFINVFGLAISIACCIVAYFNWEYDATFDDHHVNREKIFRVSSIREFDGTTTLYGHAPTPLGEVVRSTFQDVEKVARIGGSWSNFKVKDDLYRSNLAYVDPELFDMFTFEFIEGNPTDLKDKTKLFISEETAIKLFGTTDAIGKQITQVMGAITRELQVAGVFKKQPSNSSFEWDAYVNYEDYFDEFTEEKIDDWRPRNTLFVMIKDLSRKDIVEKQLQTYRENSNKVREDFQVKAFVLDPLVGLGRRDSANHTWSQTRNSSPTAAVIAPILMALLVLLIACFNMTNTAIAISSRRLKEIGIRKVMGSLRSQLIVQFLGETFFICTLALIFGLFLGEVLLGSWNALWPDMKLVSHYADNISFVVFLLIVLAFTGLLSGGYPAFYISHFEPVGILKGKLKFGGTNFFTRVLLVLQYSISLLAIIFAIAFYQNSVYQRDFDIGFSPNNVIIAYVSNQSEYETYKNALAGNSDINLIAGSQHSIFSAGYSGPVKVDSKEMEVDIIDVGDDYLKALDLKLIAGRDFRKDSETDKKESIIISEKFAKNFNWNNQEAIGKRITWTDTVQLYVVGVVKDVYTNGLWRENDPLMIRYTSRDKYTHVIVNMPLPKVKEVNAFMEAEWKKIFPNRLYNGRIINEGMVQADTVNKNIVKMFAFLGVVALMLSATGLFTLVSLNIIKKMKEIGVRKVLGASIGNITRIINTEFVVMLFIASVLGSALSYFSVDALMGSIWRYYQSTTIDTLIFSVVTTFIISVGVIGHKVFSAASMNPVSTLRTE